MLYIVYLILHVNSNDSQHYSAAVNLLYQL